MAVDKMMKPWSTGWEPMPHPLPRVTKCPTCGSVPLWRHMLRCYWIICTTCGMETASFRSPEDAAATWNLGSQEKDRVAGNEEVTQENIESIVEEAAKYGHGTR